MGTFKNLVGQKFSKLTVIKRHETNIGGRVAWVCKCDCGNDKIVKGTALQQAETKTCGCFHNMPEREREKQTKARIKKYIKIHPETGCWEWQGFLMACGYGLTSHKGKKILAHRASWLVCEGEIPNNMCVLHKCDNRKCINPDHLFLGTKKENTIDMLKKKRHSYVPHLGINHGCAKLTEEQVYSIRKKKKMGSTNKELAMEFNVFRSTIEKIVYRQTWKHLHDPE